MAFLKISISRHYFLTWSKHFTIITSTDIFLLRVDFVSSKINDKRNDFYFAIVNFPFLDGSVPRRASYGVYISQLFRFARVCNHVADLNARNKCLTSKLQQGYWYHKLRKTFS